MKTHNIFLPLLIFFSLIVVSCTEHDDIYDNTLKVGNIYLSDDRIVSPGGYNADTDDAVGVIFYVHEDTALVVGTREMGSYLYSDSLGTISNVTGDATSLSGVENTAAIRASAFQKHFPALQTLEDYDVKVTGWSLPAAGDLRALANALPAVSRSMATIGGDAFSRDQYFSTSQDGTSSATEQENYYTVSLYSGYVTSTHKWEKSRVRLILRIN